MVTEGPFSLYYATADKQRETSFSFIIPPADNRRPFHFVFSTTQLTTETPSFFVATTSCVRRLPFRFVIPPADNRNSSLGLCIIPPGCCQQRPLPFLYQHHQLAAEDSFSRFVSYHQLTRRLLSIVSSTS
ncbi:hypothetical protein AVEN_246942-1 [Araneus ventricosus]|uniref:Uncharacterized protein n=1 Tax=Araneus ventricosus TaxID=182803 RepID=A0A4Y2VBZ0_ARAVE|nr:hypothetical protein AVEN_246942-1 [Araneus ventricosus]